jgi:hypothetical protein
LRVNARRSLASLPFPLWGASAHPEIEFERAVAWCEKKTGKMLAPSQREAL